MEEDGTATTEVATLHCSKLSSNCFALTQGEGHLPFYSSSSSSWSSLLTRGRLILSFPPSQLLLPAYDGGCPRPQFPPILFSKQVCKTQFSRRLTSHLIASWSTIYIYEILFLLSSTFLSVILSTIVVFIAFFSRSSCFFLFHIIIFFSFFSFFYYIYTKIVVTDYDNQQSNMIRNKYWAFLESSNLMYNFKLIE